MIIICAAAAVLATGFLPTAEAAEPVQYHYVATDTYSSFFQIVADQPTPAGRVAPGDFAFTAVGKSSVLSVDDVAAPVVGLTISTPSGITRLCLPDGARYTITGLATGQRVALGLSNYHESCFGVPYVDATAGTITVWP